MSPRKANIAVPTSERAANYRSKNFLWALDQLPTENCVVWPGELSEDGYPTTRYNGHKTVAHRAIWTEILGPIPEGLVLERTCRNTACVNPRHCEPVTAQEAIERSPLHNKNKTHCPKGHAYSPENTITSKDKKTGKVVSRVCKKCRAERNRITDERRKAERTIKRQAQLDRLRAAELAARAKKVAAARGEAK